MVFQAAAAMHWDACCAGTLLFQPLGFLQQCWVPQSVPEAET